MDLHIVGKGIQIGQSLNNYVSETVLDHVKKYFDRAVSVKVTIYKESYLFHCDIIVNEGIAGGEFIKVSHKDHDPRAVVDLAVSKLCSKLRKYKKRIINHKKGESFKIKLHLYNAQQNDILLDQDDETSHITEPFVAFNKIEEKISDIQILSIEDALMHLDLMLLPALLFINIETNYINMIYKKDDGKFVVIDTQKIIKD